ncbi:MAG: hemerythrin domain-containing protein [Planctomycetes bacterium]|nr:hemerythrin domain-containing protein [Planctomycetota bacterium]
MGTLIDLMLVHRALDALFARHRDAVVLMKFGQAVEALERFEEELRRHMKDEEEHILPLYEKRVGPVLGGDPQFFYLEHKNLLRNLAVIKEAARKLASNKNAGPREAHEFLQQESLFLHLLEHHDLREKNILYPELDRKLTKEEREEILSRCGPAAAKGMT